MNLVRDEPVEGVYRYRRWFREAIDYWRDWQREAREDYEFVRGDQWSKEDKARFAESGRPAITINRIKPLINILSGYQRLNRYDIEFLPRTNDDGQICQVRKGITKYVMDQCGYDNEESNAFLDCAIGGLGWLAVEYEPDESGNDGEAKVTRCDPFGMYVDPEAHRDDFSDAKYICRAKWVDKEDLKEIYPEHADEIDEQCSIYDSAETELSRDRHLWYQSELQKLRLVECWYKRRESETSVVLSSGETIDGNQIPMEQLYQLQAQGMVQNVLNRQVVKVYVASFFDGVLLENIPSPYQHGELPFAPITCFFFGVGDNEIPAGIVRDLKDPQRELNRRRIQFLHILNTSSNGGGWIEQDAMTEKQFAEFERYGAVPGHFQRVQPMTLSQGKIMERGMSQIPAGVLQAEANSTSDLQAISGINEALMGVDIPSGSSGRAIELKQKQAITHLSPLFDALRRAKKKIAYMLWGKTGKSGVIPQFYTADKVYRIEGVNGQQFVRVNQQVVQQDPIAGVVVQTLNDLSQGEFDIVVSDVEASTTQRQAQMWSLVEAVSKLGIPGDIVFDVILDLSDLPNKDEIKQRWQQMQQSQQQAAEQQMQAQMELEQVKNENRNLSISFKDAPLPIQFAMAAKAGLIDPQIANYAVQLMTNQMFPGLQEQMAQQQQMEQMQQMAQMQQMQQMQQGQAQAPPPISQPPQQNQGGAVTQAAMESMMRGMGGAM